MPAELRLWPLLDGTPQKDWQDVALFQGPNESASDRVRDRRRCGSVYGALEARDCMLRSSPNMSIYRLRVLRDPLPCGMEKQGCTVPLFEESDSYARRDKPRKFFSIPIGKPNAAMRAGLVYSRGSRRAVDAITRLG